MSQSHSVADVEFYTKQNIDAFFDRFREKKGSLEATLLETNSLDLVSNLNTHIISIAIGNETCSISLNQKEYQNAVICSPYSLYLRYPMDLIKTFDQQWIRTLIKVYYFIFNSLFKMAKINQVAQINSKLHSVLKHPTHLNHHIPVLTQSLIAKYPKHALLFLRVNESLNQELIQKLQDIGYLVFPDRVTHLYYPGSGYMKRSNTKRDIALLSSTDYAIVDQNTLTEKDILRIKQLYEKLFIDKYSDHNPKYTLDYFSQAIKHRWSEFIALRNPDGVIDGFTSWYLCDNTMICSQIGYDTDISQKTGLYRMLIAFMLQEADKRQLIFNLGAGSDTFKQNRGSQPTTEYTAVYCKHLPLYRQLPWKLLQLACQKFIPKIYQSSPF